MPLETPDSLRSLPISTLENYLVLVAALEQNMSEYVEIRSRLHAAAEVVAGVNELHRPDGGDDDDEYESDDDDTVTGSAATSMAGAGLGSPVPTETDRSEEPLEAVVPQRDVLSRQIREQQHAGELRRRRP